MNRNKKIIEKAGKIKSAICVFFIILSIIIQLMFNTVKGIALTVANVTELNNEVNALSEETTDVSITKVWEGTETPDDYRATFKLYKTTYNADVVIMCIEDLVDLSIAVAEGNTYEGKVIALSRTLDFTEDASYRDPGGTSYGDLNGDKDPQTIKEELTDMVDGIGFTPIGNFDTPFSGKFYGYGNEIRNLYVNNTNARAAGFFGSIVKAQVRDLGITGYIKGNGDCTAGISAYSNTSTIVNCYNKANISYVKCPEEYPYSSLAGITASSAYTTISNCYNMGKIDNSEECAVMIRAAGIVGRPWGCVIEKCYNIAEININSNTKRNYTAGIAAETEQTTIKECYNTAKLVSTSDNDNTNFLGGIAAVFNTNNNGYIINCYNTGNLENYNKYAGIVGGIVGDFNGTTVSYQGIVNCYNTGNITSDLSSSYNMTGGIIGNIYCLSITNCYNTGTITGKAEQWASNAVGEIGGSGTGCIISKCYYTGIGDSTGSIAIQIMPTLDYSIEKSMEEMKTSDFVDILNSNINEITDVSDLAEWIYNENNYPTLDIESQETIELPEIPELIIIEEVTEEAEKTITGNKEVVFSNLKIYENSEYTIKEVKVERYNPQTGYWDELQEGVDYTMEESKETNTITNIITPPNTTDITVTKVWEGTDNPDNYKATFKLYKTTYNADVVIMYIEDLVDLSIAVNEGNSYEGKTILLARTLDFNEDWAYRNPQDKTYGDINQDNSIGTIKEELTDNIDGIGFTPIGINIDIPFSGSFYGYGNQIKNLYINKTTGNVGFFGYAKNAKIIDLTITGSINSKNGITGGIVGLPYKTLIDSCKNEAIIVNNNWTGGIAGYMTECTISNCSNVAKISSVGDSNSTNVAAAGITGYSRNSVIQNCYNEGEVISDAEVRGNYAGGIVGQSQETKINQSYNTGNITLTNKDRDFAIMGGIVGSFEPKTTGVIKNCYNTGTILNQGRYNTLTGGITGYYNGVSLNYVGIANCYNLGNVTVHESAANQKIGGLVGELINAIIKNSYNAGVITGKQKDNNGSLSTGEILGFGTGFKISQTYCTNAIKIIGNYTLQIMPSTHSIVAMEKENMKSSDFVNTLNTNITGITDIADLAEWEYTENEFPKLKFSDKGIVEIPEIPVLMTIEEVTEQIEKTITGNKQTVFSNLEMYENSEYIVKEIKVERYNPETDKWEELQENIDYTLEEDKENYIFTNIVKELNGTYSLSVVKVNKENPEEKVSGAEFDIYENDTKVGTLTDSDGDGVYESGLISIHNVGTRKIIIKETVVPKGFEKVDDIEGTITFEKSLDGEKYVVKECSLGTLDNGKISFTIEEPPADKYDLSLKKFISAIDDIKIEDRAPIITLDENGKIKYTMNDKIEQVANNQTVTYTLRMFNESNNTGKGKRIIEYIPDGLVFLPENEKNKKYEWSMFAKDENNDLYKTDDPQKAIVVVTDYLVDKEISAFDNITIPNSLDVEVVFKVDETKITSEDRIIENKVQIMPNNNDDYPENDECTEKIYVKYFDLKIEKYIKSVTVKNGEQVSTQEIGYDKKDEIVQIDVKRSQVKNTTVQVTYGLIVKNVGEIPGYATNIIDYIPDDFKLINNEIWTQNNNKIITTSLENVLLNPGENEELQITFEWNLADGNIGSRINTAKIDSYKNDYNAIDYTDDNEDNEEIIVTVKTGSELIKIITLVLSVFAIIGIGVIVIKKKVLIY